MSKEAVAQFLAKLSEDPKLQDQLVQFAAQHGFEFTTDELSDADPQKHLIEEFVREYSQAYKDPGVMVSYGADAAYIVVEALKKAGDRPAAIRDAIENTTGYVGLSGVYNMTPTDHNGLSLDDVVLIKVQDGKFRLVKK